MLRRIDGKKLAILSSSIIIIFIAAGYFINLKLIERKARNTVEKHLEAVITGKGNPYDTVDVLRVKAILENVRAFLYLDTLKRERVKDKPLVIDRNMYEKSFRTAFKNYDEFIDGMKKIYGKKAKQANDGLLVKRDERRYEFEFLYDVTLTNRLGQEVIRTYVFEVKPSIMSGSDFDIAGFHEVKR
ncbi:MAG: hypothetical protein HZA16_07435 [Nitrospirae bacterium]|nr:hypothetical protein [Nitrospirota bacterium]